MKTTAIGFWALILCALAASHAVAQDTQLKPGAIKGETLTFTKARNYEFCEFYIGSGPVAASTELDCYNSTASSTGCPAATFATIEPKKLAADLGASFAFLNTVTPTTQKWWVMDEIYVYAAGATVDFSGIK